MNTRNIFAALAVFSLGLACTPSEPEVEETVSQKISASVVDNGSGALWAKSDAVGVYTDASENNVKYTTSSAGSSVSFTASTEVKGAPKYAYYPYSSDNASRKATGLVGKLAQDQTAGAVDYRYGVQTGTNSDGDVSFEFRSLFVTVAFNVDLTGSSLDGQEVTSLICKVTRDGSAVPVVGSFTYSAADGSYSYEGRETYGEFSALDKAVIFPTVKAGDILEATVNTAEASATVSIPIDGDVEAGAFYSVTVPVADAEVGEPEDTPVLGTPVLTALSFTAEANPGKILAKELYYDPSGSNGTWTKHRAVEAQVMTVADGQISGCIPYLNDRSLVPAFEYTKGASLQYSYDGGANFTEWDGTSAIDFSKGTVIRVAAEEAFSDYVCNITNTGLPVVVVNQPDGDTSWPQTGEYVWSKETDFDNVTPGEITVYNADGTVNLATATAMTRLRGNTSKAFPKKPFAVKLDKKASVLSMPKHKRWVLLANWKDKSLMRNHVAFGVAQKFTEQFADGIPWQVHGEFVELVYNGVHVGNYYLCEQIKIDENRLNIKNEYDGESITSADVDNFGYLMECDDYYDENTKFVTRHYIPFQFKDDGDAGNIIKNYVKTKVQGIEDNLYKGNYSTAYNDFDIYSFADYLLINELAMNSEIGHPRSLYVYMNGTGKLCAGPVWDFDWQAFPINSGIKKLDSSWDRTYTQSLMATASHKNKHYRYQPIFGSGTPSSPRTDDVPYMWYPMLVKDATFKNVLAERWSAISGVLSAYAYELVVETGKEIALSWEYNNAVWPAYYSSNCDRQAAFSGGFCGDELLTDFEDIYMGLYDAYMERLSGMDSFVNAKNWPSWSIQVKRW